MCQICNPNTQRNFYNYNDQNKDIRITYYSYNNHFKLCCLEDYKRTDFQLSSNAHYEFKFNMDFLRNSSIISYKNNCILVYKLTEHDLGGYFMRLKNGRHIYMKGLERYTLTINIINITKDIILESNISTKLNAITNLEITNDNLKEENNKLKFKNKSIKEEINKLKSENHILKKEVEYYNSLKPKYDYNEMKQNKKILHNEYKRIYKLIKKNIGFNLC